MNIGQIVHKPYLRRLNRHDPILVDNTTLLGIEIEVEHFSQPPASKDPGRNYWDFKKDDSLRNNGMEMVFIEPFNGADVVVALKWIFEQAHKCKWKTSKLTGIHVHLDVRDMEVDQFRSFCVTYSILEPLIYHWIGRSRFENMFCLPWYMADNELGTLNDALDLSSTDSQLALVYLKQLSKYSGLNVGAASKFGTVEFRMMETHFDFDRMIDWLNIILSLKAFSLTNRADTVPKKLMALGPGGFAEAVFGHSLMTKMWYPDYNKDAIGIGLVTADCFLKNTQELEMAGKSLKEKFSISRSRGLSARASGTHKGVTKWVEKYSVIKAPKEPKKAKTKPELAAGWNLPVYANDYLEELPQELD